MENASRGCGLSCGTTPAWAGLQAYLLVEPITGFALEMRLRLQVCE